MILAAMLCAGCAGVSYHELTEQTDARGNGFRYYDPSPYLLVQTDGQGGLKSELKWLPDLTKLRQAKPYQFLASNDSTFQFADGVLTQGDSAGDGTAVPKAFIAAAEKVVSTAIKAGAFDNPSGRDGPPPQTTAPRVYLFKIVQNGREYALVGAGGFEPDYQTKDTP